MLWYSFVVTHQTRSIDLADLEREDAEIATEPGDASAKAPSRWTDVEDIVCTIVRSQVDVLWRLDAHIQYLSGLLDASQPFGSRKVNIRWYENGRGRRDPTPIQFVKNTHPRAHAMPGHGWSLVRLDRAENKDTPLRDHIRVTGPFANAKDRAPAISVARLIERTMAERKLLITSLGETRHRAAAASRLLKRSESFLAKENVS